MNFKKLFVAVSLMMAAFTASAQEKVEVTFNPHWFVQAQVGGQYTLGEASFTDLISPNAQLALGYQFNPVLGLRLGVNAWQSKGGWGESTAKTYNFPSNTFKWNYFAPALDVKINLVNLFAGYNPDRVFGLNLILGGGVNIAGNLDDASGIYAKQPTMMAHYRTGSSLMPVGRAGLDLDFAVSDRVSLNVEGMANVLNDHYNGKHTDNADWYFNALVGIKVALGKTKNKKVIEEPAPAPAPAPVVKPEPKPEPKPVVKKEEPLKETFFYNIRLSDIDDEATLNKIVAWCNEYPSKGIVVSGYADKGTGNARVNKKYAEARATKAADAIKAKGVSADRITVESYGDTVQPFAENDKNRCVIVVGE